MKILLIWPEASMGYYSPAHFSDSGRTQSLFPNLALPTLAALTPDDVDLELCDENICPIDYNSDADVIGISGFYVHWGRMQEIAKEFRDRGKLVVIGGPFATLSSKNVRIHCDVIFKGEAEKTWPQFIADFKKGEFKNEYVETDRIDMSQTPVPDWKLMPNKSYSQGMIQTTRGCPFSCDFCDVIAFVGRKVRTKKLPQIEKELDQLYDLGYRFIMLADDNLTVQKKYAKEMLTLIKNWNESKPETTYFSSQLSIDLAWDQELLELAVAAGLTMAYIGIETSNKEALAGANKMHNVRSDLLHDVKTIQSAGLAVFSFIISGFDQDTVDIFEQHYDFVQKSSIPFATPTLLVASEQTPLHARLQSEGRLLGEGGKELAGSQYFNTNIIPKQMTHEQLILGQKWLLKAIYQPAAFRKRFNKLMKTLPKRRQQPPMDFRKMFKPGVPGHPIKGFMHIAKSILGISLFYIRPKRWRLSLSFVLWLCRRPNYLELIAFHISYYRLHIQVNSAFGVEKVTYQPDHWKNMDQPESEYDPLKTVSETQIGH